MKTLKMPFGVLLLLCLFSSGILQAQESEGEKEARIRAAREKIEMEMNKIETRYRDGKVSADDYEEAMEDLQEELEEALEDIDEGDEEMREAMKEVEEAMDEIKDAFEGIDNDRVSIESPKDSNDTKISLKINKRKSGKRTKSYFLLNFGPTDAFDAKENEMVSSPEFSPWKSWSGNIGLMFSSRIGGPSSIFYVNYGVLWKYLYLETNDNLQLSIVDDNPQYITPLDGVTLSESEFSRHSLIVPLQLRFAGPSKKSLNVMLGGYGGLRLYAFQDLEYKTAIGENAELRLRDEYKTNPWQYGVSAAVGQRWWQLYADYELSGLFENNPNNEYNVLNAGVQFFF
jgi:hypothetical protein